MKRVIVVALALTLPAIAAQAVWAVGSDKVKFMGGTVASVPENTEGRVDVTDPTSMLFKGEKGGTVNVPWQTVESIEYGQRVSRRWKTAIFLTPWAVFSRGRKHIVTVAYKDAQGTDQAAVFEFGKNVYRTALAALKAKSGQVITCQDEEARKFFGGGCTVETAEPQENKSRPAARVLNPTAGGPTGPPPSATAVGTLAGSAPEAQPEPRNTTPPEPRVSTVPEQHVSTALSGRLRVLTEPVGADVYIGSLRIGSTTPDGLLVELPAGSVAVSLRKAGYLSVERTVTVDPKNDVVLPVTLRASQER